MLCRLIYVDAKGVGCQIVLQAQGDDYTAQPRRDQEIDANLLFRWMDMLQIDRSDLAKDNTPLFHELQGLCTSCLSKEEYAQDLAHELDDARWTEWRLCVRIPQRCAIFGGTRFIGRVEAQVPLQFS